MSDRLINRFTRKAVGSHDRITDRLGREWLFWLASKTGVVKSDPVIIVRRILPDGRPAKNTSDFSPEFFPDYTFDNTATQ